jgi:hypothetical protein
VGVGLISYPLYLWHWPILWLTRLLYPDSGVTIASIACFLAIVAAWATYAFVEQPIRRQFRTSPRFVVRSLSATIASILAVGALISYDGVPERWDSKVRALLTYKFDLSSYRVGKCHLAPEQGPSEFPSECFSDNSSAKKRAVLWGDSTATAIYPGMRALNDGSLDVAELTASGCPPFGETYQPLAIRPNCASINEFVMHYIERTRPDVVILSSAPNYGTDIPKQFLATISRLRAFGVPTVVVVGPPPIWPAAFPRLILRNYFNRAVGMIPDRLQLAPETSLAMSQLDAELAAATATSGARFVSSFERLCPDHGACTAIIAGEPALWDGMHLAKGSSGLIARDILSAISPTGTKD